MMQRRRERVGDSSDAVRRVPAVLVRQDTSESLDVTELLDDKAQVRVRVRGEGERGKHASL